MDRVIERLVHITQYLFPHHEVLAMKSAFSDRKIFIYNITKTMESLHDTPISNKTPSLGRTNGRVVLISDFN